jgi:hypothetical protein
MYQGFGWAFPAKYKILAMPGEDVPDDTLTGKVGPEVGIAIEEFRKNLMRISREI